MLPLIIFFTGALAGFWSYFIEPSLVELNRFRCSIKSLPPSFEGLKVLQFSDIHFRKRPTKAHLKALQLVKELKPDLILFTGDFLCYSNLPSKEGLKSYLQAFEAPLGCFAVLGNHDYETHASSFRKKPKTTLVPHHELIQLLKETPFKLLRNSCVLLEKGDDKLNLTGIGDLLADDVKLEKAFENWNLEFPGLVLSHNPEALELLIKYPGDLILSGHTHGNQINIPFLRSLLPGSTDLRRGLVKKGGKKLFINRGLGAHLPLRFLSRPEITFMLLCTVTP